MNYVKILFFFYILNGSIILVNSIGIGQTQFIGGDETLIAPVTETSVSGISAFDSFGSLWNKLTGFYTLITDVASFIIGKPVIDLITSLGVPSLITTLFIGIPMGFLSIIFVVQLVTGRSFKLME